MEIKSKNDSYGNTMYTAVPPAGTKLKYPIGYFPTEQQAVDAYNNALVK